MKETRHCLCDDGHVPSLAAFVQVLPNPSTLQRVAISLEDMHVISNPLLDKGCEECCGKAEDEGHEPKGIHTDIGCRWVESGESRR